MRRVVGGWFLIFGLLLATTAAAQDVVFPPGIIKLQEYQDQLAHSITLLIAFLGGILTFTSPCGFVVIPTFFSYLFKERKRAFLMTSLFSLGMIIAFVIFGIIAGLVGDFFNIYKEFFATLSGLVLILFGIMLALNTGFGFVDFRIKHQPKDGLGSLLLGFFFAIGWTPCVGPILGGVLLLAANTANVLSATLLFGSYALGVTLPLLIVSYFSDRYDFSKYITSRHVQFTLFRHTIHTHLYGIIGGIILALVGIVMVAFAGTRVFMNEIPKYIPWTMSFFTRINESVVASTFWTGTTANLIGAAIALTLLFIMVRSIYRAYFSDSRIHKP